MSRSWERCWIIGAGLLGSALATLCRAKGKQVLTLDKLAAADVAGDAAEAAVLSRAGALLAPDVVFLCQATHGGTAEDYRRTYTEVVAQVQCCVPQAQMVFCSSSSIYGSARGVATELTLPEAPTQKAQILLQAEHRVLAQGGAVARMVPLYATDRCELLRRHMASEPRLPGKDNRMLNYVHAEDAAAALMLLASETGVYNVCGESLPLGEAYALLEAISGIAPSQTCAPSGKRGLSDRCVDSAQLQKLGWRPRHTLATFFRNHLQP